MIVYSSTSVGFSQSTICLTSLVSSPLVVTAVAPVLHIGSRQIILAPELRNTPFFALFWSHWQIILTPELGKTPFFAIFWSHWQINLTPELFWQIISTPELGTIPFFVLFWLHQLLFHPPLANHIGSRIREDPVLHSILVILGLSPSSYF